MRAGNRPALPLVGGPADRDTPMSCQSFRYPSKVRSRTLAGADRQFDDTRSIHNGISLSSSSLAGDSFVCRLRHSENSSKPPGSGVASKGGAEGGAPRGRTIRLRRASGASEGSKLPRSHTVFGKAPRCVGMSVGAECRGDVVRSTAPSSTPDMTRRLSSIDEITGEQAGDGHCPSDQGGKGSGPRSSELIATPGSQRSGAGSAFGASVSTL